MTGEPGLVLYIAWIVGGIMIAAKSGNAQTYLQKLVKDKKVVKDYIALQGAPGEIIEKAA